ncbi:MAG: SDR family NAD(P)-dependent oxidoreductase [Rhodospirillales bacterium]
MKWTDRKVLVTGADGFIGSHLAEALVRAGADVTVLSLYNSFDRHGWLDHSPQDIRAAMHLVRGDVRDPHQMKSLVAGHHIVFHLAALIAIPYSYAAPASYVDTNIQGTLNLLTAARDCGIERFVHTSTSEVYGTAQFTPITEDHPLQGQSPYSASKIGADVMVESFYRSFDLPAVILRPFNTYGPRQSERAVISTIIRQVLDPRCAVIRIGDMTPKRDFNYVGDTVSAFMALADAPDTCNGQVFNAGTGRMVTIRETFDIIMQLCGCSKDVVQEEERTRPTKSEVFALMADAGKLQSATDWVADTMLEQGLEKTIAWWSQNLHLVRDDSSFMR